MSLLVTGYNNPDLDATACAIAYVEYLNKTGTEAVAGLFGTPHREAQFVAKELAIDIPHVSGGAVSDADAIAIVDASDLRGLEGHVPPEKVVEIIDHRELHHAADFPHATAQIELVGAAATLIAEKFQKTGTSISKNSTVLLYAAIISNTVNFNAGVTTERDRVMAAWLLDQHQVADDFVQRMFQAKSSFQQPLKDVFAADIAFLSMGENKVSIVQLEIVGVDSFLKERREEIGAALSELQSEHKIDFIFLTCVDVAEAFNCFVCDDRRLQHALSEIFEVEFHQGIAKKEGVLMRKQIAPVLKKYFEQKGV